jgi:hypothetical protein
VCKITEGEWQDKERQLRRVKVEGREEKNRGRREGREEKEE